MNLDHLEKIVKKAKENNIEFSVPELLKFKPELDINSFPELLETHIDYIEFTLNKLGDKS